MPGTIGNKNAEKWTKKKTKEVMLKVLDLLYTDEKIITETKLKILARKHFNLPISTYEYFDRKFKDSIVLRNIKKEIEGILEERVMTTKDMYPGIAAMTLKNKHGWVDKKEIDQNVKGEIITGINYIAPCGNKLTTNNKSTPSLGGTKE